MTNRLSQRVSRVQSTGITADMKLTVLEYIKNNYDNRPFHRQKALSELRMSQNQMSVILSQLRDEGRLTLLKKGAPGNGGSVYKFNPAPAPIPPLEINDESLDKLKDYAQRHGAFRPSDLATALQIASFDAHKLIYAGIRADIVRASEHHGWFEAGAQIRFKPELRSLTGNFPCPMCDKVYQTGQQLSGHRMGKHGNGKEIFCKYCGNAFVQPGKLASHVRREHKAESMSIKRDSRYSNQLKLLESMKNQPMTVGDMIGQGAYNTHGAVWNAVHRLMGEGYLQEVGHKRKSVLYGITERGRALLEGQVVPKLPELPEPQPEVETPQNAPQEATEPTETKTEPDNFALKSEVLAMKFFWETGQHREALTDFVNWLKENYNG